MTQVAAAALDGSTLILIERAHEALLVGYAAESATARHRAAQLAALRAAAAVVAARGLRVRSSRPGNLWELLLPLTPELAEWARHFAAVTTQSSLVVSGHAVVSVRAADDLLRDAETFLARVELIIGLPARIEPVPRLAPVRSA